MGALLFCPCHLPLTGGAIVALIGGGAWLGGNVALLYLAFGVTYVLLLWYGLRYIMRRRDEERELEAEHARHAAGSPASSP